MRECRTILLAAPRLTTLIVPQWMIRMPRAGGPRRVPLLVVDILLEVVHELAIEVALHIGQTLPVLQPKPRVLLHVRDNGEDLGARPVAETSNGVSDEQLGYAIS